MRKKISVFLIAAVVAIAFVAITNWDYLTAWKNFHFSFGVSEIASNPCNNHLFEKEFKGISEFGNNKWNYLCMDKDWELTVKPTNANKSTYEGERLFVTFTQGTEILTPLGELTSPDYKKLADSGVAPLPWSQITKKSSREQVKQALINVLPAERTLVNESKTPFGTKYFRVEQEGISPFDNKPFHTIRYLFPNMMYDGKPYNLSFVTDIKEEKTAKRVISKL